jgi:hypothetical protein
MHNKPVSYQIASEVIWNAKHNKKKNISETISPKRISKSVLNNPKIKSRNATAF